MKDPIEGESLAASAKMTGGSASSQYMGDYPSSWSGDNHLFWTGQKVGDTLTLTLPAQHPGGHDGMYDIVGYFTKAGDYGQVSFSLNGKPLSRVFDGYNSNGVVNSGPVTLGRVTLPAGPSQLVVTSVGKNAESRGLLFGLDALVFKLAAVFDGNRDGIDKSGPVTSLK